MIDPASGGLLPELVISPSAPRISESELRQRGLLAITQKVKQNFPELKRKQVRQMARTLEKKSWAERDRQAVAKITCGN